MLTLTDPERRLLERLADAGKPTQLFGEDLKIAKSLESDGIVFMVRDTPYAVITPKGRHVLAGRKRPFGFSD